MREPSRLVALFTNDERNRQGPIGGFAPVSRPNLLDYRERNQVLEGLAYYGGAALSVSGMATRRVGNDDSPYLGRSAVVISAAFAPSQASVRRARAAASGPQ